MRTHKREFGVWRFSFAFSASLDLPIITCPVPAHFFVCLIIAQVATKLNCFYPLKRLSGGDRGKKRSGSEARRKTVPRLIFFLHLVVSIVDESFAKTEINSLTML